MSLRSVLATSICICVPSCLTWPRGLKNRIKWAWTTYEGNSIIVDALYFVWHVCSTLSIFSNSSACDPGIILDSKKTHWQSESDQLMTFNFPLSPNATASTLNRSHPLIVSDKTHLDTSAICSSMGSFSPSGTTSTLPFSPYMACAHSDTSATETAAGLISRLHSPGMLYPKSNGRTYAHVTPPSFVSTFSSASSISGTNWDKSSKRPGSPLLPTASLTENCTGLYSQSTNSPTEQQMPRGLRTLKEFSAGNHEGRPSEGSTNIIPQPGQLNPHTRSAIGVQTVLPEAMDPHNSIPLGHKSLDSSSKSAFKPHTRTPSPTTQQSIESKLHPTSPNVAIAAMAAALAATGLRFPSLPSTPVSQLHHGSSNATFGTPNGSTDATAIATAATTKTTNTTVSHGGGIPEFSALMAAAVAAAASAINNTNSTLSGHRNTPHSEHSYPTGTPTTSNMSSSSTSSLVSIISQPMDDLSQLSDFKQTPASFIQSIPMQSEPPDPIDGDSRPKVDLVDKYLWDKFHAHGTEMVITKSGR